MRPTIPIAEADILALERLLKETTSKPQMQRIQCVLLRARRQMNSEEVAASVGWSPGYVRQVWSSYLQEGTEGLVEQAKAGGILVVSEIHRAYEREVGHEVPKSTIYRMLARQGWRKVAPRSHHPKNDPEVIVTFKKNSHHSSRKNAKSKRH